MRMFATIERLFKKISCDYLATIREKSMRVYRNMHSFFSENTVTI